MSDRPIQVGDLVQVVRVGQWPCDCPSTIVGHIFTVSRIVPQLLTCCGGCGFRLGASTCVFGLEGGAAVEIERLKRIPPLDELEGQRTEEVLREPSCTA